MSKKPEHPSVGLGVIIQRGERILLGQRKGWHEGYYSIPGGLLETGETFEEGAFREVQEETGLELIEPRVIALTNNLETFARTGKHHISVILYADQFRGEPSVREPDKCAGWNWYDPRRLPEPHFEASRRGVACFLRGSFYERGPDGEH
ncbi:MAG TPA: NUDIX domain-containing protein [Myxococcaceae bacterium]|nr:NUDIX domain-containing protein [Myxococcaceae bacterium]